MANLNNNAENISVYYWKDGQLRVGRAGLRQFASEEGLPLQVLARMFIQSGCILVPQLMSNADIGDKR